MPSVGRPQLLLLFSNYDVNGTCIPDQLLSPRRKYKAVSGFGLWVGAAFIILSVILLERSLSDRAVTPLFNVFNNVGVSVNSTLISWHFRFPSDHFSSVTSSNASDHKKVNGSVGLAAKSREASVVGMGMIQQRTEKAGNLSDSGDTVAEKEQMGAFSEVVEDASVSSEEKMFSLSECLSVDNSSIDINPVTGRRKEGSVSQGAVEVQKPNSFETWIYLMASSCPILIGILIATVMGGQTKISSNGSESQLVATSQASETRKESMRYQEEENLRRRNLMVFRFEDFDCTVDFVISPFLVRESSVNLKTGELETLRLDFTDKITKMYKDSDIIVFNTGHWWTHEKTSKGEDYYQEGDYVHPRLQFLEAYKRALFTWARWVDKSIRWQWKLRGKCRRETEPILNSSDIVKYPSNMRAFEHVLQRMKTPVAYLKHKQADRMYNTEEERITANRSQDCSHWCLPGVLDTWNELLYASLLKPGKGCWRLNGVV
ncbi:hypothetical protein K2173_005814 [Erythroxylum novogranatense]|uniref:Trichome birefringence-like C-terminal domain-containing protein n=1 Tax=Erythroxylum novogranatense TaxID=1862640 RepID=A0AAV8U6T5_9ROSI|nr:hypothetical protein K2173_005814 [Erythroxylum novogranatense]